MNKLGQRISFYRKQKGLSQEKLAELLDISRQAVTKWENGQSNPTSENLIKLAEIFGIDLMCLLNPDNASDKSEIVMDKGPYILSAISIITLLIYIVAGIAVKRIYADTLIPMIIISIPMQLFLTLYYANAIKSKNFTGMAGYSHKTEYNIPELKKVIISIIYHINIASVVYVVTMAVFALFDVGLSFEWAEILLLFIYITDFISSILIINYRSMERVYKNKTDVVKSKASFPIIIVFIAVVFAGMIELFVLMSLKEISNNTAPALVLALICMIAVFVMVAALLVEMNKIEKWQPDAEKYNLSKSFKICFAIAVLCFIFMPFAI